MAYSRAWANFKKDNPKSYPYIAIAFVTIWVLPLARIVYGAVTGQF